MQRTRADDRAQVRPRSARDTTTGRACSDPDSGAGARAPYDDDGADPHGARAARAASNQNRAVVDALIGTLATGARADYIGEPVSQLDHALQAAALARAARASDAEVLAALLHDIGHLCAPVDAPRMAAVGVSDHERTGAAYLTELGFGRDVTDLVSGHVAAKRYLVTTRPSYRSRLSSASLATLLHQGGPMTADERAAFERDPARDAMLRVRAWDEAAKTPGLTVPGLESYRTLLEAHLARRAADARCDS